MGADVDARDVEDIVASKPPASCAGTEVEDKRRIGLELTPEGTRVLASVKRRRTAWLAERLRGLSTEELDAVDAAVEPLLKLLEVSA